MKELLAVGIQNAVVIPMPGKYRPVSTAEKRAQLEAAGEEWPVCECHGEPKRWSAVRNRPRGGHWRCRIKNNSRIAHYKKTEKGRRAVERYNKSDKKRENDERFRRTHFRLLAGGMYLGTFPLPGDPKEARAKIAEFKQQQKTRTREMIENGWIV